MPFEMTAETGGRRTRRYVALGLIQSLLALEALGFALFPPSPALGREGLDYVVALGLSALSVVTAAVLPHLPRPLLHVSLALTWCTVGLLAWTRATPQGQITIGLSLILLTFYVGYFLRGPAMVAHIVGYSSLYLLALVMHPLTRSPLFATIMLTSIAFVAIAVPRARDIDIRYQIMLRNSADVIIRTRRGVVTWVSPSVREVLGWEPEEFTALPQPQWHPDDTEQVEALRAEVYADRPAAGTYRLRCKDGSYRWVEARINPIRDSDGARGSVASVRDIQDRVLAERALAAAEEKYRDVSVRLEQEIEAQARLFQNLSHELRTPLTVIRGPLQHHLRDEGAELSDELRADLDTAVRASRRMERLVDDLLTTSHGGSGANEQNPEPSDAGRLTRGIASVFAATASASGLTLDVAIDATVPDEVLLDRESWTRILVNLLSNAFKYTANGGVKVDLSWEAGLLRLEVHDTGVGIAPDERDLVFERFFQARARPAHGEQSSGLGLALVAELVRELDGTCTVDSAVDQGSTFTVTLPAPTPHPTSDPAPGATIAAASTGDGDGGRVLVVEDEPDAREFISRVLVDAGYSVVAVPDAFAAQAAIAGVDLVLSDIGLPGRTGFDLLRWVRVQPQPTGMIPVILLSGSRDGDALAQGIADRADDFLAKPFDPEELCRRAALHISLHRHRRDALAASTVMDGLAAALTVDEAVGSAIGAMMAQRGLTPDEALSELRAISQESRRPMAAVALDVLAEP